MNVFSPTALAKFLKSAPALLAALGCLSSFSSAQAGILDVLRGEAESTPPSFQRVAFIGSAMVKEVEGEAERLVGIDAWKPLEKGAELVPGDLFRTRNGTVLLRMNESSSFVKVTPRTVLRLVELENHVDRGVLSGTEERKGFAVRGCRGKAFVREPGQEWKKVEVNAVLAGGSEIRTEPETVVDLFNTKRQRPLRIQGPVLMKLQESAIDSRTVVGLRHPSLLATVHP